MSIDTWRRLAPAPKPLHHGQEWNVFLSYRSINRPWVINLYDVLVAHGHKVFLDQCVVTAGDELIDELELALERSQAGILVWSSAATDSSWVRREYRTMESMADDGLRFVPIKVDASTLPAFARTRVFLDFSAYPDGPNGGELLRLLHAVVGKPLGAEAMRFAAEQDEVAAAANAAIEAAIDTGNADRLTALFSEGGLPWQASSSLGCKAANGLISLGRVDAALDMLTTLAECFPRAIRPKQLRALALARRHAQREGPDQDLQEAQTILATLYREGERDPESVGILARTWHDRYEESGNRLHLMKSRDLYAEAFESARDDYYVGINAAAKSVFLGELEAGTRYARRVAEIVGNRPVPGDYWLSATVAEVSLIRGKLADAAALYAAAVQAAPSETGNHASTRDQAKRLLDAMNVPAEQAAPVLAAFAHLADN